MDSLITAAGQALARGDPLGALNLIALRADAPALALRGIAMAQLGDHARAKVLLRMAGRAFRPQEAVARARCVVAEAEIALASRDLRSEPRLDAACAVLETSGDLANAAHGRCLKMRRLVLMGHVDEAEDLAASMDPSPLPAALRASYELGVAGIAMRRLRAERARAALLTAQQAAEAAGIPALIAEVEQAFNLLLTPAARLIGRDDDRPLVLHEVEAVLASEALVVDACRYVIRCGESLIALTKRPILFMLARTLAEAWPGDAARDALVARAFRLKLADESHRARLRVEIGRLRKLVSQLAEIRATRSGFRLCPRCAAEVLVLARPIEEKHAAVLALLSDGEAWSTSALALALGTGQRTVQRALDDLSAHKQVQAVGRGRARRWMTPPLIGFATTLLLPSPLVPD